MSHANNLTDVSLSAEAEREIVDRFESGRQVRVPKSGSFFELPSGDSRLIPLSDRWVVRVDDIALHLKPNDFPAKGFVFFSATAAAFGSIFMCYVGLSYFDLYGNLISKILIPSSLLLSILSVLFFCWLYREPADFPVLLNRRTGKIIQMCGKEEVEADWSEVRPFLERVYSPHGTPFWKLHAIKLTPGGGVDKRFVLMGMVEGPDGCLRRYEFLRRYMLGQWEDLPRTRLVEMRRPLLKQFRNDFIWMFGKRPWHERPAWLKGLIYVLVPLMVFVSWPFAFFTVFGTRLGWIPSFPADVQAAASGGRRPAVLEERVLPDPPLAHTEKWFYGTVLAAALVLWSILGIWGTSILFSMAGP